MRSKRPTRLDDLRGPSRCAFAREKPRGDSRRRDKIRRALNRETGKAESLVGRCLLLFQRECREQNSTLAFSQTLVVEVAFVFEHRKRALPILFRDAPVKNRGSRPGQSGDLVRRTRIVVRRRNLAAPVGLRMEPAIAE